MECELVYTVEAIYEKVYTYFKEYTIKINNKPVQKLICENR